MVIKAWKILYKEYPCFWQIVCIIIHDIGYCGKDYLTNKSNNNHAELGALIGYFLFGDKAWIFLIGHSRSACTKFKVSMSSLEPPDDYSWMIAPAWWLKWNTKVEPQLHGEEWREAVKKNWENGLEGRRAGFEVAKELMKSRRV
jgi:hypothetical protein